MEQGLDKIQALTQEGGDNGTSDQLFVASMNGLLLCFGPKPMSTIL